MIIQGKTYKSILGYRSRLLFQTQAVITRAKQENFLLPSDVCLYNLDIHIRELINLGIWDNIDAYFNFAYNSISLLDFSKINLIDPFGSLISTVGNPIYTNNGWEGNAVDGYIDTGWMTNASANYQVNSSTLGGTMYKIHTGAAGTASRICSSSTVDRMTMVTTSQTRSRMQSSGNLLTAVNGFNSLGWKSIAKNTSGFRDIVNRDLMSNIGASELAADPNGLKLVLFSLPVNGLYSNIGLSNFMVGGYVSNVQTQQMRLSYNKYLKGIGLIEYA